MRSYLDLLEHIVRHGEDHKDRTGIGTVSVFGYQWRHSMVEGFPLLTTKKIPFRWVFEELKWFLSGSTNEKDLRASGVDIWKEWATAEQCAKFGREEGDLGPVYGKLWRNFPNGSGGVDQVGQLLIDLSSDPNSRRLIVSGWHPYWASRVALPPCHTLWQVKCHGDSEISLHLYARSIDAFLGLPFNIASYGLMLCLLAIQTDRVSRELVISFGDLHIYKNHLRQVATQLCRAPRTIPRIKIDKRPFQDGKFTLTWGDVHLLDYSPHSKIAADVAV